jgi:hypothetical protein
MTSNKADVAEYLSAEISPQHVLIVQMWKRRYWMDRTEAQ